MGLRTCGGGGGNAPGRGIRNIIISIEKDFNVIKKLFKKIAFKNLDELVWGRNDPGYHSLIPLLE